MSDQITYDDKADLIVDTTIDDMFKVSASDMNEIKSVVNGNADEVGDTTSLTTTDKTSVVNAVNELNAPEKWVSVGITAPTDGRRVFFAHSKNVLQHSAYDRTLNGVTLKVNDDKSITLTGTATANTNFNIGTNATIKLKAGTYTFTKGATNVQLLIYYSSASVLANLPIGTSSQTITINSDTTYENYRVEISIPNGTQTNETVYPMLRLSTTSNTYEPYVEPSINVDEELLFNKDTFDQNTSLITEYGEMIDDIETRTATRVSYLLGSTIGWKRIAKMGGMSGGTMMLSNTPSYGTFGEFNFTYAAGYGNSFTKIFKITTNGQYFNKARIIQKGNAEGYLELYQQFEYSRTLTLVLSPLSQGVTLYTQETKGSIPDGYTATEYTFT